MMSGWVSDVQGRIWTIMNHACETIQEADKLKNGDVHIKEVNFFGINNKGSVCM